MLAVILFELRFRMRQATPYLFFGLLFLLGFLCYSTEALQVTDNQVVLNLVPVLDQALRNVEGFASSVVGKPITIPPVTADELPSAACAPT